MLPLSVFGYREDLLIMSMEDEIVHYTVGDTISPNMLLLLLTGLRWSTSTLTLLLMLVL